METVKVVSDLIGSIVLVIWLNISHLGAGPDSCGPVSGRAVLRTGSLFPAQPISMTKAQTIRMTPIMDSWIFVVFILVWLNPVPGRHRDLYQLLPT